MCKIFRGREGWCERGKLCYLRKRMGKMLLVCIKYNHDFNFDFITFNFFFISAALHRKTLDIMTLILILRFLKVPNVNVIDENIQHNIH